MCQRKHYTKDKQTFLFWSIIHPSIFTGFIPSASIPLQKQLEHANQQSGFTDSVSTS